MMSLMLFHSSRARLSFILSVNKSALIVILDYVSFVWNNSESTMKGLEKSVKGLVVLIFLLISVNHTFM